MATGACFHFSQTLGRNWTPASRGPRQGTCSSPAPRAIGGLCQLPGRGSFLIGLACPPILTSGLSIPRRRSVAGKSRSPQGDRTKICMIPAARRGLDPHRRPRPAANVRAEHTTNILIDAPEMIPGDLDTRNEATRLYKIAI